MFIIVFIVIIIITVATVIIVIIVVNIIIAIIIVIISIIIPSKKVADVGVHVPKCLQAAGKAIFGKGSELLSTRCQAKLHVGA